MTFLFVDTTRCAPKAASTDTQRMNGPTSFSGYRKAPQTGTVPSNCAAPSSGPSAAQRKNAAAAARNRVIRSARTPTAASQRRTAPAKTLVTNGVWYSLGPPSHWNTGAEGSPGRPKNSPGSTSSSKRAGARAHWTRSSAERPVDRSAVRK
jgi:hypothetical protein